MALKVKLLSVCVDDQNKGLAFYTDILGFVKKHDIPVHGEFRWITVVSPDEPEGTEVTLEPGVDPATITFKASLFDRGIPWTAFLVDDIHAEYERLKGLGVRFTTEPMDAGPVKIAVFDDTCGNLIQIFQV